MKKEFVVEDDYGRKLGTVFATDEDDALNEALGDPCFLNSVDENGFNIYELEEVGHKATFLVPFTYVQNVEVPRAVLEELAKKYDMTLNAVFAFSKLFQKEIEKKMDHKKIEEEAHNSIEN